MALMLFACGLVGCYDGAGERSAGAGVETDTGGTAGESGEDTGDTDIEPAPEGEVAPSGMRRLSRREYDNTIRDLLEDDTAPAATRLPADVMDPFDNDFTTQVASRPLIEGLEALSGEIVGRLMADPPRRDRVIGCVPAGTQDEACLRSFITTFGRRALRRPLTDDDIAAFEELAQSEDDFYAGVEVVLRSILFDPEFVFRIEIGDPTDEAGVFRLNDFEVATRMSYFLWGTTPDDALLARAEAGELRTPDQVRATAEEMVDDPRALDRVDEFHAMWLGYATLGHAPDLAAAMRAETRALLEQVVFEEKAPWVDVFAARGTYVNDLLAEHYGLPTPGSTEPTWVEYGDSPRQGLLAHGSFLSVETGIGDTSPTKRGKFIRTRLMCQAIAPPPPDVPADEPPANSDSDCKWDAYAAHRQGACATCHEIMDPVGFGLENYDQEGKFRLHDNDRPQCEISGEGDLDGETYVGVAGLADLLVESGAVETCAVMHTYRFAVGHEIGADDSALVETLQESFADSGYRLDTLMVEIVSDETFGFRKDEE